MNVATPQHLRAINLLGGVEDEETEQKTTINFLMFQALQQVATMPFTIMLENWRYGVFNGTIPEDEWMKTWWEMKTIGLGSSPPLRETKNLVTRLPFIMSATIS